MRTILTFLVLVACIAVRATAFDDSEEPAVRDSLNALMRTGHWSRTAVMADSAVLIARGHAWAPGSRIVMTWEPETGCLLVEGVTLMQRVAQDDRSSSSSAADPIALFTKLVVDTMRAHPELERADQVAYAVEHVDANALIGPGVQVEASCCGFSLRLPGADKSGPW